MLTLDLLLRAKMAVCQLLPKIHKYTNPGYDCCDNRTRESGESATDVGSGSSSTAASSNSQAVVGSSDDVGPTINRAQAIACRPTPVMSTIEELHREENRLLTFENWSVEFIDRQKLALLGFYFLGYQDVVKCAFCRVEIGRWEPADDVFTEHYRWSTNCPLLRRRPTANVPIDAEALNRVLPSVSYDTCGPCGVTTQRPAAFAEASHPSISTDTFTPAAVFFSPPRRCDYAELEIEANRLATFREWPRNLKMKPEELCDAGFFYTGIGDRVQCFSCGGGLKDWEDNDCAWEQHARWYDNCEYLKLIKGQKYIDEVKAKNAQTLSPSEGLQECSASSSVSPVAVVKEQESPKVEDVATTVKPIGASAGDALENKLCKICFVNEYNTAFLPCGHVVACAKCASSVTSCPLCREPFTTVTRIYFS
ncbi:death-associated inhibitor of apoptosis 1-like [Phlebotomus argentipes]|uniref:death-associated inhibitor of apoptosis 1-like n=1 Tax=Phlebotomus argentipes TaxID=94469 RepID=UPI0028933595|nr:death-associated inhibitor of apoptosis 1-like [Phlebotomus argentipes]XP_059614743.1 death-associated inhibitor of apoptosis 1-like [Phlebotomus argentipes]XP_059614744.1 death-associated inhibitor of apoptosis 1-like [Phlebotomus argentipes]XP_059614745.1 death-associated inhibitor of apoptosis 1-like [Phlebotomus argentipes]XP_059614746.1 death-associated inhibitor of apoptosis 1-like [Phlebotomus argentipes]